MDRQLGRRRVHASHDGGACNEMLSLALAQSDGAPFITVIVCAQYSHFSICLRSVISLSRSVIECANKRERKAKEVSRESTPDCIKSLSTHSVPAAAKSSD